MGDSRVIKFRAWQPHNSLHRKVGMYDVESLEFYIDNEITGEAFLKKPGEEKAKSSEYINEIALMQYTGLKDKNGVMIFEGDILVISDDGEYFPEEYNEKNDEFEPIGRYEIFWSEDGACFWVRGFDKTETPELEYSPWNYASYEIIGNIYEPPKPSPLKEEK